MIEILLCKRDKFVYPTLIMKTNPTVHYEMKLMYGLLYSTVNELISELIN